jgi:hypothetical protein
MTPIPPARFPIAFEPEGHRYAIAGKRVPPVTTILASVAINGRHLIDSAFFSDRAAERGTNAHADIAAYCRGEAGPDASPYVAAFHRFALHMGFTPEASEIVVGSQIHGYAGTADMIGYFTKGRTILIDIKTGPIHDWHALQLGAYAVALRESHGVFVDDAFILALAPPNYVLHNCPMDLAAACRTFLGLRTAYGMRAPKEGE